MSIFGKTFGVGVVVIAMLIGVTSGAFGQAAGGGGVGAGSSSAGARGRRLTL
jgi:hypothetical protein